MARGPPAKRPKARVSSTKTNKRTSVSKSSLAKVNSSDDTTPPPKHSLTLLPLEIKTMIFREIGPPPSESPYLVESKDEIHPCYAICSLNKQLRREYLALMGEPATNIEVVIYPEDYLTTEEDAGKLLKSKLDLLGHQGRNRIGICHVYGCLIERETGNSNLNHWLGSRLSRKRLEPEDKVRIKQHVEEDLNDKIASLQIMFKIIDKQLRGFAELKISPGELPSNIWSEPVKDWILKQQDSLKDFTFVKRTPTSWKYAYPYLDRLTKSPLFDRARERPSNYPSSMWSNRIGFEDLEHSIRIYLLSRAKLQNLSI